MTSVMGSRIRGRIEEAFPRMRADAETDVVGVVPAAGQARRLGPLPCSKEVYPIGWNALEGASRPKVAAQFLLEAMQAGGAGRVYVVIRRGKWDIPDYFGDGSPSGLHLAYLMMGRPFGAPYTVDQAYPFVRRSLVLFGYPDILVEPRDAFARLVSKQRGTGADLVLGLFRAGDPAQMDMVRVGERVERVRIKPSAEREEYTWMLAVWGPAFADFLHQDLRRRVEGSGGEPAELYMGEVIDAAIRAGLEIEHVTFEEGSFLDIGTPENLRTAIEQQVRPGRGTDAS